MRVTENLIYSQSSRSISQANEKMLSAQEKLLAQTDIVKPSDNPVGASQILMHQDNNNRLKQYDESIKMAKNNLEYQEVALESLNDSLDDIRTLFIQAQNDINSQEDLDAIGQEVAMIANSMAELMNSRSADGNYIFAGTDTHKPPFVLNGEGRYQWAGNEGQKFAQISEDMKVAVSDSGKRLFQDVWTNKGFTSELFLGDVSLTGTVSNQEKFNQFMADNYDPVNPADNVYRLTTLPLTQQDTDVNVADIVDTLLTGSNTKEDQERRRGFDGTPGVFKITNSLGEEVSSGSYVAGKPIEFAGMSFTLDGAPGAEVGFSLDKPKRDNVLNEIKDTLAVLGDKSSTKEERRAAFQDVTVSIHNTQRSISEGRSSVGSRLNTLSSREDFSSSSQLSNTIAKDRIGGLDIASAASELSMKETALNASQKVFTRMSNLSLFDKM